MLVEVPVAFSDGKAVRDVPLFVADKEAKVPLAVRVRLAALERDIERERVGVALCARVGVTVPLSVRGGVRVGDGVCVFDDVDVVVVVGDRVRREVAVVVPLDVAGWGPDGGRTTPLNMDPAGARASCTGCMLAVSMRYSPLALHR